MASFPDLRPRARLAKAKRRAVLSLRRLVDLLTAFAVLHTLAFVAVSELATLRGKRALQATGFSTRELRSHAGALFLVGTPMAEASPA